MTDDEEYLISYANIKSNLFKKQKDFLSNEEIKKFYKNEFLGIPQGLPLNIKFFDYSKAKIFKINTLDFSKKIFKTKNLNYIGNRKFFRYGNIFATNVVLKKKYKKKYNFYLKNINNIKQKIKNLNKLNKKVCSMQIRNVPHFGHEAVFQFILSNFDLLVLNPIFGLKKKNDFKDKTIETALKFIEKKYRKIKFLPIYSNFYYGGPREALHHLNMREQLGFNHFYIGRDHAGAENLYHPFAAIKKTKKFKNKFKISQISSKGGGFCRTCDKYLIKNSCIHERFIDISGTEFRSYLSKNRVYKHADKKLQNILFKSKF